MNKVKTTGQAAPEVLKVFLPPSSSGPATLPMVPVWSPLGDWIMYSDHGLKLVSPDGKTSRDLAPLDALCTFSRDESQLYCERPEVNGVDGRVQVFTANLEGKVQRTIGWLPPEDPIRSRFNPGFRLSLDPDGRSITYGIRKSTSNLWMIDGLSSILPRR